MKRIKGPALLMLGLITVGAPPALADRHHLRGTIDQLLELDVRPFAIAHHGFGDNMGQDPTRPIENTVPSVRLAFRAGVSVVEVDVQLTRDGRVAVFHDDFLSDFTCINQLSLAELQDRLPFVPSLGAVLREARKFNEPSGPLSGLVIVELKAASPLCDPHDTEEEAIVTAVTRVIRQTEMTDQVILNSFSPALLYLAAQHAPEIARDLGINVLQFLTPDEVERQTGLSVTLINKKLDLGLQWAEAGSFFRLPGYRSPDEVFRTAAVIRAQVVEVDKFIFLQLLQAEAAPFVDTLHRFGLKAFGWTATTPAEWFYLQSLGLDGIYTDDIPFGVEHQAPIP